MQTVTNADNFLLSPQRAENTALEGGGGPAINLSGWHVLPRPPILSECATGDPDGDGAVALGGIMKTSFDESRSAPRFGTPLAILLLSLAVGCGSAGGELQGSESGRTGDSSGAAGGADGGAAGGTDGGAAGGTDGGAGSGAPFDPNAGVGCTLAWSSGFETGFPGEWLNWSNGYSAEGMMPSGRVSAWTIVDDSGGDPIYSGRQSYKGWIEGSASQSHRAYPALHTEVRTPLVNTFMVYLDADYGQMSASEWIHFGTWGNEDDQGNGTWALHTMSVRDRQLEFAHTTPFAGEYIGPSPQPAFPVGQWVRFTVYLHYEGSDGFVQVWQDGVPMLRAQVARLGSNPGATLTRAHWGMYAHPDVNQGIQYNDDIGIWELDAPLSDFQTEPDCYLGR